MSCPSVSLNIASFYIGYWAVRKTEMWLQEALAIVTYPTLW
jgi:hypothetical protein